MKHQVTFVVCAVLVAGLLVGCGGKPDTEHVGPKGPLGPEGELGPSSSDFTEGAIVIKKSGVLVTEEYPFTDFSQLEIGMFDVEVRQGEGYSVVLEMDENVLDHVQVTRESETLRIGLDPSESYQMENIHSAPKHLAICRFFYGFLHWANASWANSFAVRKSSSSGCFLTSCTYAAHSSSSVTIQRWVGGHGHPWKMRVELLQLDIRIP
jgi:hypothetical protein